MTSKDKLGRRSGHDLIPMDWSSFVDLGGLAGFAALAWQAASTVRERRERAELQVRPLDAKRDLAVWQVDNTPLKQKVFTLEVVNVGHRTANRCIARLNILQVPVGASVRDTSHPLHWAGTDYTTLDTGANPVDIGSEHRRLDVVFTRSTGHVGCWIATPLALSDINGAPQNHLPPGSYEAEVVLSCDRGRGCRVGLRIESPTQWSELSVVRVS